MKRINLILTGAVISVLASVFVNSCVDPLKFGNEFLEKAPGGTITADTVFSSAEYTRRFVTGIYSKQYFAITNLETRADRGIMPVQQCHNYWKGMPDALSDIIQYSFANATTAKMYYSGALTATADQYGNYSIYPYTGEYIWQNVHNCYLLLENIDSVPEMTQDEKDQLSDEVRCMLANAYFVSLRFLGGLPLVYGTFSGSDAEYEYPRASLQETADFILDILNTVIKNNKLRWGFVPGSADESSDLGRWTIAGAMALKIKLLTFLASPLVNSDKPYFDGKYTMEHPENVWLGGYDVKRWNDVKTACEELFAEIDRRGIYHLVLPEDDTFEDYCLAFREGYLFEGSPEVIMGLRTSNSADGSFYTFYSQSVDVGAMGSGTRGILSYNPTQEYIEMFPWADGRPFDWDETEKAASNPFEVNGIEIKGLDNMFIKGDTIIGTRQLHRVYTRDPRLYESVGVNGVLRDPVSNHSGARQGRPWECWVGGYDAGERPVTNSGIFGTGYRHIKYFLGDCYKKTQPHWVWLSLNEVMLDYAEALAHTGDLTGAIRQVDQLRARVGMKGLVECNPGKNLTGDVDALIDEIVRERACELMFSDDRYFTLIRYKRAKDFEKELHRLVMYRLVKDENGNWVAATADNLPYMRPWYGNTHSSVDNNDPNNWNFYEPSHFTYERRVLSDFRRYWWDNGFDCKWYFQPFTDSEVLKGYGLEQNAGW